VYRGLEVTDAEVKAEFDQHPDRYKIPEAREVTQILVSTLEAAQAAKAKLEAGVAFDQVAADFAKDPAMVKGSKGTGWVEQKTLPPGFEAVFQVAEGEVTPPIPSKVGFHVVKVLKVKPEQPLQLANVKSSIHDELLAKRKGERTKEWTDQLRAKAKIAIDDKAIKRFVAEHPAPATTEAPPAPASHGPEAGSGMPPGMGMDGMPGGMPPHQMPPPAAPSAPAAPPPSSR
jgi:parvulin-like peptidyl-prolyl isomerase